MGLIELRLIESHSPGAETSGWQNRVWVCLHCLVSILSELECAGTSPHGNRNRNLEC